ncbi:MAG: 1-acyl-sn-glycerol-3-phosphate acyltransferase [Candidatus Levybacteria bacterium]|nr:1-acyl-sn-glycerol-3-phosphate acyltransferase [Candidatus Levybacteria bacterium]
MAKEISKYIERKLHSPINAAKQTLGGYALDLAATYLSWSGDRKLKPQGEPFLTETLALIKKGERPSIDLLAKILSGFNLPEISDDLRERLEGLKNQSFVLIGNHPKNVPIAFSPTIVVWDLIHKTLGKDVYFIQSKGNFVTHVVHDMTARALPVIQIDTKKPFKMGVQISRAVRRKQILGLYPEGKNKNNLVEAKPEAGDFLYFMAGLGIPTLPVAVWFEPETDNIGLNVGRLIAPDEIKEMRDPQNPAELIHSVMQNHVAPLLPPEQQGFYSNGNEPKGSFRNLITIFDRNHKQQ